MKSNGAIGKVMLIVLLSILGSYCFGSYQEEEIKISLFGSVVESTREVFVLVGSYCQTLWANFFDKLEQLFGKEEPEVEIQMVDELVHGNDAYCTDGRKDCIYNSEFFNDTWVTGKLDDDPTTHLDIDTAPMRYVKSEDMPSM